MELFKVLLTVVFWLKIVSLFTKKNKWEPEIPKVIVVLFFTALIAGIWLVL